MSLSMNFNSRFSTDYYAKNSLPGSYTAVYPGNVQNNTGVKAADIGKDVETGAAEKTGRKECQTCKSRKYVDRSDDAGVSFKTPAHVSPEASGAAVRSHEQEHVSREGAKAHTGGRKVIAQSVQIYTDVCPECGRVYTSGGKTTTLTKTDNNVDNQNGKYIDVRV